MFRECWAETAFISLLQTGIILLLYTLMLLAGIITGAHDGKTVFPVFVSFPPVFIASVAVLVMLYYIASAPLCIGVKWYYWHAAEGNVMPVSSIFAGYRSNECALRFIKLKLLTDMRRATPLVIALLFIIVDISLTSKMVVLYGDNNAANLIIKLFGAAVFLGIVILFFISIMKYIPAGYLLADNPDLTADSVISTSKQLVSKKYAELFFLYMSFIGWYASCLLVFPLIILAPYIHMTTAVFIQSCMNRSDEPVQENADAEKKESLFVG